MLALLVLVFSCAKNNPVSASDSNNSGNDTGNNNNNNQITIASYEGTYKGKGKFKSADGITEERDITVIVNKDSTVVFQADSNNFTFDNITKIDDKWLLLGSLSEWKEILGAKTEEETLHFLYHNIGVSQRVPTDHVYFGNKSAYLDEVRDNNSKSQIDNYYCNNFDQYNQISKAYNYSYVPDTEFLSKYSLSEALGLILKDKRVFSDIMNNSISLFYRSIKSETVRYSYSAYILRAMPQFLPLQTSVIQSTNFECGVDYDYLEKKLFLDRITQINPLLVTLGAQKNIGSLSTEQLYKLLSQRGDSSGIQRRYKELREAIKN